MVLIPIRRQTFLLKTNLMKKNQTRYKTNRIQITNDTVLATQWNVIHQIFFLLPLLSQQAATTLSLSKRQLGNVSPLLWGNLKECQREITAWGKNCPHHDSPSPLSNGIWLGRSVLPHHRINLHSHSPLC